MSNNDQKKSWRNRWLNSINELTDINLQEMSWLDDMNSNPHWSFVEFTSCYFDDLAIADLGYKHFIKDNWVSESEFMIIKNWHESIDLYMPPYGDVYNHRAILADEKWRNIVENGNESKNELVNLLSIEEQDLLKKLYTT